MLPTLLVLCIGLLSIGDKMSLINLPVKKQAVEKYTWATKPTSAQQNKRIIITDIGPADETFIFKGSRWVPINGQVNLSTASVNTSLTGTTTNTQLHEVVVPAGLMSPNGQLEIVHSWAYTNSANSKTLRIYFGTFGGTSYYGRSDTTTAFSQVYTSIKNRNDVASQIGINSAMYSGVGSTSGSFVTSTLDTSTNQSIIFSAQLASAGETATLKGFKITYRE